MTHSLALDLILLGFPGSMKPDQPLFNRPNAKLLEDILYFLLKLSFPNYLESKLGDCWPVTNSMMARKYRIAILKWMEELRGEGQIPRDAVPRKSMLEEGVGQKLEECLAKFAEFVLMQSPSIDPPSTTSSMMKPGAYALASYMEGSVVRRLRALETMLLKVPDSEPLPTTTGLTDLSKPKTCEIPAPTTNPLDNLDHLCSVRLLSM